jgi:hypothetical protein
MLARFLIRFDAGLAWIERYLVAVVLFVSLGLAVGLWVGYLLGYDRGLSLRRDQDPGPADRAEFPPERK